MSSFPTNGAASSDMTGPSAAAWEKYPERGVSVIIPAHNSAKTLEETIRSLQRQTWPAWEAVIVNDGSTDATPALAEGLSKTDPRIRVHTQAQHGMAAARNAGLGIARYDWILCLDADDWIAPEYFASFFAKLLQEPSLDAVCCDWACVGSDGKVRRTSETSKLTGDLFPRFARGCVFAIHACVFRKALLSNAGVFDETLRTCADWDFWQRLSRTGARFGAVSKVLAYYRVHWGSSATDGHRIFQDGLRVISRGHSSDSRVEHPDPAHAQGCPAENSLAAQISFAFYCAGLLLGSQREATELLDDLPKVQGGDVQVSELAETLFYGFLHTAIARSEDEIALWQTTAVLRQRLLARLQARASREGLADEFEMVLDRLVIGRANGVERLRVGHIQRIRLDAGVPLMDIEAAPGVTRCQVDLTYAGAALGQVELPVYDGLVSAYVLEDLIATRFAWDILKRFFARSIYAHLRLEQSGEEWAVWRDDLLLGRCRADSANAADALHDHVGWTVFLQELWGERLDAAGFYPTEATAGLPLDGSLANASSALAVEVSDPLPSVATTEAEKVFQVMVAGFSIGIVSAPSKAGVVEPVSLRSAITSQAGFELCRVAVREALVGRPDAQRGSLRERLAAQAHARRSRESSSQSSSPAATPCELILEKLPAQSNLLLIGRRFPALFGTAFSTRSALPGSLALLIREAMKLQEESGLALRERTTEARVFYAPDLILPDGTACHPFRVRQSFAGGGAEALQGSSSQCVILRYTQAPGSKSEPSTLDIGPEQLRKQLRALAAAGFVSMPLAEWVEAALNRRFLPRRACHISFDQCSPKLLHRILPVVSECQFSASVFFDAEALSALDRAKHTALTLTREDVHQFHRLGVELGVSSPSGCRQAGQGTDELGHKVYRARLNLQRLLEQPVWAFAFTTDETAPVLRELLGACGYCCGLTSHWGVARFGQDFLELPRIKITGAEDPDQLASKLDQYIHHG